MAMQMTTATFRQQRDKKKIAPGQRSILWISRLIIWVFILFTLFPIYFVVLASLRSGIAFFSTSLLPHHITFSNYQTVLTQTNFLLWMRNSLVVGVSLGVIQVFITGTSAYAFSRLKFFGRKYGLMTLLILQMFPNFMAISAIYSAMAQLNLLDNLLVYILILSGGSAFSIWLLKGYMDTIPRELDEAAIMDGANHFQIYLKIVLPLCLPMLTVLFLMSMIGTFSEFIFASALLQSPTNYTLGVGLFQFITGQFAKNWTEFSAAALMAALPLTAIFMAAQKWIQSGLVAGSVKG